MNANEQENQNPTPPEPPKIACEVRENGSLVIHGMIEVTMPDGTVISKGPRTSFCRCGASANKPFCDGAHKTIGFQG